MLKCIPISYELADTVTEANLRDMRDTLLRCIEDSAGNYEKPWEQENLRHHYQTLFALEEVLRYFVGEKWND